MAILTLNRNELEKEIGKINEKILEKISMFGTPVENFNENELSIEVFPNRPDLLSFQGFKRAMLSFLEKSGINEYSTQNPAKNYKVIIEKEVKKVRPFTACAIVKNLKLNNEKIKEIIDIQEKLHLTFGRNRKKLAIGIYPLEKINLPITYTAKKPEEIKFIPLESNKEMNARQILSQHPTGREYANLLEGYEVFPVFIDANNEVLSVPPIINSDKTGKINESTKEVFIECSGFNIEYLKKALNMIVCAMSDMGGKIYQMEIQDKEKSLSPNLDYEEMQFSIENINKTLGIELTEKEVKKLLEKMNLGYKKEKNSIALVPPYRTDILHEIDIAEEVAIAYGYENFIPQIPQISTIGTEDKISILKRKISEILIGLGLLEISTFHISTKEKQYKNLGIRETKEMDLIEIIDSKTENNILRTNLAGQSMTILSENSNSEYPQKLFEIGKVFSSDKSKETEINEKNNLCIALCSENSNFTEIKQVLDYLFRMLDIKYEIKDAEDSKFIDGRCGKVILEKNNKPIEIGLMGEISPNVLKNHKIKMPVSLLEICIENLE